MCSFIMRGYIIWTHLYPNLECRLQMLTSSLGVLEMTCVRAVHVHKMLFVPICGMITNASVWRAGKVMSVMSVHSQIPKHFKICASALHQISLNLMVTGTECLESSNDCENNKCENNAECVDLHQNYTCDCGVGYTGQYCQDVIQVYCLPVFLFVSKCNINHELQ